MALPKLYEQITWVNDTTPALNEDNLNAMSQALDDIDDRVIGLAGTIMEDVPQIIEDMEILTPAIENIDSNVARAEGAADDAEAEALKSEGYALGTQDGVAVTSGEYYQNNAKYYAEIANPPIENTVDFTGIIAISDAINKAAKDVKLKVEAVQDLHGYIKPWVGGAGGNMLPKEADYVLTVATSNEFSTHVVTDIPIVSGKTYTISCLQKNALTSNVRNALGVIYNGQTTWESTDTNYHLAAGRHTLTFTSNYTGVCTVDLWSHTPSTQVQYTEFMMEEGSAFTSYRPYTNICPITGHSQAKVTRAGFNQWDEVSKLGTYSTADGSFAVDSTHLASNGYIRVYPNTDYYYNTNGYNINVCYYDKYKNFISNFNSVHDVVRTTPNNCAYIAFNMALAYGVTYNHDICINISDTAKNGEYEPSKVDVYTIDLDGTRYGGVLDVDAGTLTVDRKYARVESLSGKSDTAANNVYYTAVISDILVPASHSVVNDIMCDSFDTNVSFEQIYNNNIVGLNVLNSGRIGMGFGLNGPSSLNDANTWLTNNPTYVVYWLATPQTITLTPTEVELLLGYNTLFADTGDLSLTYDASGVLRIANAKLDIDTFKSIVAASSGFADFKTRVAAL